MMCPNVSYIQEIGHDSHSNASLPSSDIRILENESPTDLRVFFYLNEDIIIEVQCIIAQVSYEMIREALEVNMFACL